MKLVRAFNTVSLLFLFLGTSAVGHAQQEQQKEKQDKPEKQAAPAQQKGQQQDQNRQQHAQQQQQDQNRQQQRAQQQQDQNNQQQRRAERQQPERTHHAQLERTQEQRREQEGQQRGAWQQRRAQNWESEHRTWQQRGGYSGYRIPDDYYRSYYGSDHYFRVYSLPFLYVGGNPRFQYGGYWFSPVDPYPEYWGDDWYETDRIYVVYYDNGYYLYNRRFADRPGIAISISL